MSRELCFNIENQNLYLEQVLVDYMDIPIFFLCKGRCQYYIALCTDIEELGYIVTKLSLSDTYNLLHGKISMRDVILKQKEYWDIISGDEITLDVVTKCEMSNLEKSLLPEENAYFEILTKQIEIFVQQFDNEYFSMKYFSESDKKVDLYDVFEEYLTDDLFEHIKPFTELADCKIERTTVSKVTLYAETMKPIKTEEINFNENVCEMELSESVVSNTAAAA